MHLKKRARIILISYNSKNDLIECIPSLKNQTYPNYEIIVVDNGSTDNTPELIKSEYPNIKLVETGSNPGYPAGNNIDFDSDFFLYLEDVDLSWRARLAGYRIMRIAANKIFNSFFRIYYKLLDACLIDPGRLAKFLNFNTLNKQGML